MFRPNIFIKHWRFVKRINGWLGFEEAMFLFESARTCKTEGVILEIGSYRGRSTVCMALGSSEGSKVPVYSIDPFKPFKLKDGTMVTENYREGFLFNLLKTGCTETVKSIVNTSDEAAKEWHLPISLLFIDGEHSYDQVKKDWFNYSKFIVKGGVVAFHDYSCFEGVKKLVDEVRGSNPMIKVTDICSFKLKNLCAWVVE